MLCAHTPVHFGSWWHRARILWVPAIRTDKRKKSVAAQSVRALRLLRAMRLQQVFSMHICIIWVFTSFSLDLSLFLSPSLPSSPPERRDGSQRLVQMRARNALAAGVKYTHLHTLGIWWQRAPMRFPIFCINQVEHLEMHLRTVVGQRFAHQLKCS